MKNLNEIIAPVYLELHTKNGLDTDVLVDELTSLAEKYHVIDAFQLEGIVQNVNDNNKTIVYISLTVVPSIQQGVEVIEYIKAIFENYFNYYPKFTEPV